MSGRKYSQVELAAQVSETIRCRIAAEDALVQADSLSTALAKAAKTTAALRETARAAASRIDQIRSELETTRKGSTQARLLRLDIQAVRGQRAQVDALRRELSEIGQRCQAACGAGGAHLEAAAVADRIAREREAVEPWLGAEYTDIREKAQVLLVDIEREIRMSGTAPSASRIRPVSDDHEQLLERVKGRRLRDADRRYIAEALQRVCTADLGFAATILAQRSPLEDLIVEVNTHAYGMMQFRLELDGTVRSQSEMITDTVCPTNFGKLEARLREMGVVSRFVYEADQTPVIISKDQRPEPQVSPERTSQSGG